MLTEVNAIDGKRKKKKKKVWVNSIIRKAKIRQMVIIVCLVSACLSANVSAQKNTKQLNLKLSVYGGAEDENKLDFASANFFLLEKNPIVLLKELKLEESFIESSSNNRKKISDDLYLKAASLILIETDKTQPLISYVTGWNYSFEDEEIDEDLEISSFVINDKFKKNLVSAIRFDYLSPNYSLKIQNQKFYLFGFCRVGEDILVWNQSVSGNETEIELDQYNSEFIFSREEFEKEIN